MELKNKHVVITGAASGLGLTLLQELQADNRISVIARPSSGLENLRRTYPDVAVYEADLANMAAVEQAADDIAKADEKVDILINNAAVQYTPRLIDDDFRFETIRREIDINFTSVCTLIYLLMPALMASKDALIVNVNSGLGLVPKTSSAIYCGTKGALNIFSQSLAYQLEGTNVSVSQVFLPMVATGMTQGRGGKKISPEQAVSEIIAGMAAGRTNINVGKVKLLRVIQRLSPRLAARILKGS